MRVLPGVLGYRTLRRTVQVRLGSDPLRLPGTRRKRLRCAWHTLLHCLATSIREISGLARIIHTADKQPHVLSPCLSVSSVPNNQVEETLLNLLICASGLEFAFQICLTRRG